MCGSGGGYWHPPRESSQILEDVENQNRESEYRTEVESIIRDTLKAYNERDTEALNRHIDVLKKAISKDIDDFVEMRFGGSVSKHSYVNGLSDIDILVNIGHTELASESPQHLLQYFAKLIQKRLPKTEVGIGKMSVIIKYSDKSELQLLPAEKTATGVRIPTADGKDWSHVVKPQVFAKKLTDINGSCGGNVVPIVKLFKGVQDTFPKNVQLSGYHIESLAVNAFRNYPGNLNRREMFHHFCNFIAKNVTKPIKDSTGQSIHVDDKLGSRNSTERRRISHYVGRLCEKLNAADSTHNVDIWNEIFD